MRPLSFASWSIALAIAAATSQDNTSKYHPRPYRIDVSHELIEEIRFKAAHFRPTVNIAAPDWFDGPPVANVSQVAEYMANEYDWWEYQDMVNSNFSHYYTTVPAPGSFYPHEVDIHFIHQRSNRKNATPLLLLHGWSSSSLEWEKVIHSLSNPKDISQPAFHVIAPDLPGFGFSPAPVAPGFGGPGHAAIFASLMEQLGYESYAVYSTDLGYVVATQMVEQYEERIVNHVTDFYFVPPNATDLQRFAQNQTTEEETRYISSLNAFLNTHSAYSAVHDTYPLSIAYALNDSPVGFVAWIWQIDATVRDLSVPFSLKEMISQALVVLIPGVYGNIRSYKELFPIFFKGPKPSRVPTSVTQWGLPKPLYPDVAFFTTVVSGL